MLRYTKTLFYVVTGLKIIENCCLNWIFFHDDILYFQIKVVYSQYKIIMNVYTRNAYYLSIKKLNLK